MRRREAGTNYKGPAVQKGGPGSNCVAYVVFISSNIICQLQKLILLDQT
jgi:hypothetical protein